jgi:hypothetical protein
MPLVVVELGVAVQTFANPLGPQQRSFEHEGQDFTYRVVEPTGTRAAAPARAVVSTLRIGGGGAHGLYGAFEGELGGVVTEGPRAEMVSSGALGTPTVDQTSALAYGGLGVFGVRGGIGPLSLGVELAGGIRGVTYSYHSRYLSCEQTDTITALRGVVEARARAAYWLSPTWTVGVQAGSSLLDRDAWMTGLYFGAHSRSFAGGR